MAITKASSIHTPSKFPRTTDRHADKGPVKAQSNRHKGESRDERQRGRVRQTTTTERATTVAKRPQREVVPQRRWAQDAPRLGSPRQAPGVDPPGQIILSMCGSRRRRKGHTTKAAGSQSTAMNKGQLRPHDRRKSSHTLSIRERIGGTPRQYPTPKPTPKVQANSVKTPKIGRSGRGAELDQKDGCRRGRRTPKQDSYRATTGCEEAKTT